MPGKSLIRYIRSLHLKKNRKSSGCFVAEGVRTVDEILRSGLTVEMLCATEEWIYGHGELRGMEIIPVQDHELEKISGLTTPNQVLAVVRIPRYTFHPGSLREEIVVGIESLQDPGNLGTILRLADWFGIRQVVCSGNTVDAYNPKVVQATMGSIARVRVNYLDLQELLAKNPGLPVTGTGLGGESIYHCRLPGHGLYLFGNESRGLSTGLRRLITREVSIPAAHATPAVDSLNVSTAVAIVLFEVRRQERQ